MATKSISKTKLGRGLKRCAFCGEINGNRAQLCRNMDCVQNKNSLDAVQMATLRAGTVMYSLRTKEREAQPRNFVCIEDVTLSLEQNAAVVSTKAFCYLEACKNDANCRHIKACRVERSPPLPKAQVYSVSREVLWNLNIGQEQKQQLWNWYKSAEEVEKLPAVQRLNATTFAVKCERSETFPAARLHVTAVANGLSSKKGTHACACKKLKLIVESDNSVVMQEDICDHLLLVLAAILSSPQGKTVYANFTNSLKSCWMPSELETPLGENSRDELSMNIKIGGECDGGVDFQEDILIFGDTSYAADELPEFSDVILNLDAASTTGPVNSITNRHLHEVHDANLLSASYDMGAALEDGDSLLTEATHLELTDCNIELMDQYQLTDQIDLCSEDIALPIGSEPYNILAAPPIYTETAPPVANQLPPIELPTIAVVKKTAIKATNIVNEVKSRKQPPLPAKRALIVNGDTNDSSDVESVDVNVEPALAYSAWLDYVIELLNERMEPTNRDETIIRLVQQDFHVHRETFSHFSKSFSAGIKRRALHEVKLIENGKHKGLTKYVWHLCAAHSVKRIFSTQNISLQLGRPFECQDDGTFVPYVRPQTIPAQHNQRPVYSKLKLYMVSMLFKSGGHESECGVLLSWIPDVLPRSNFGLMQVQFTLQIVAPP